MHFFSRNPLFSAPGWSKTVFSDYGSKMSWFSYEICWIWAKFEETGFEWWKQVLTDGKEILVWAILKYLHQFRLKKLGRFGTKFGSYGQNFDFFFVSFNYLVRLPYLGMCPQRLKMCPKNFLKNVFEFARSFASKRKKSADRKTFQKNWPEKGLFWGQNDVTKSRKLTLHLQLARTSILPEILVWAILKHLHPFRREKLGRFDIKFA